MPCSSKASTSVGNANEEATYTRPSATEGTLRDQTGAVHSGWHTVGVLEQFVWASALAATSEPPVVPT